MPHFGASAAGAAESAAGAAESAAGAAELSALGVAEPLELPPQAARARARTAKANAVIFMCLFSGRRAAVCECIVLLLISPEGGAGSAVPPRKCFATEWSRMPAPPSRGSNGYRLVTRGVRSRQLLERRNRDLNRLSRRNCVAWAYPLTHRAGVAAHVSHRMHRPNAVSARNSNGIRDVFSEAAGVPARLRLSTAAPTVVGMWKAPVCALALVVSGCSSSPTPGSTGSTGDACTSSANAARERVLSVVEQNRACASDADCVTVNVNATCFDACTRTVNQAGKGAVDRASTLVEASECKAFGDAKCKLEVPPCAPPAPPHCNAGKCE